MPIAAFWCLILMIGVLIPGQAMAAAPRVVVNGQDLKMEVPPVIENGRTLVPFSAIANALSASVDWDGPSRTVTVLKGCDQLVLTVGDSTAYKNGSPISLPVPAQIIAGRTMVPLSFIGLALGASVEWDAVTRTVFIYCADVNPPST
ncbi:MAG: copper amine oxidase N-terminal domain-containing protein [Syntrophomonas sp.]